MGNLTDIQLRNWIKTGKPVSKSDGDGLTFTLSPKGTAAWTLRYYVGGKRKEMTIGRYLWSHIDFERREWTIPSEHAKNGKKFVIPLADQVVSWFSELHTLAFGSRFVLPIRSRKKAIGDAPMEATTLNAAINRLCAGLDNKCRRFTPHDLRSTARSYFSALGVNVIVAERCLNHSMGGLLAIYDQHDYMAERRAALALWGKVIEQCEAGNNWNVVSLQQVAA